MCGLIEKEINGRIYKPGQILELHTDTDTKIRVIVRKVSNDKIWHSLLNDNDIPLSSGVQGFIYDYRVKKIIEQIDNSLIEKIRDLKDDVVRWVTGIPHDIINIVLQIKQFFRWGWFMCRNHDWDWNFFLDTMDKKLSDMEKYQRKDAVHLRRHSVARQIALTRKYLKRVKDNTVEEEWHNLFEKKYGVSGMYSQKVGKNLHRLMSTEYSKCIDQPEKQAQAEKTFTRLAIRTIPYYTDKERKILFWLLYKYLPYWWD